MMVEAIAAAMDTQFPWLQRPSTATTGQTANFFLYNMPDTPDFAVAVYQYPGKAPRRKLRMATGIEQPRLQVLVRSTKVQEAMSRSEEIKIYLKTLTEVILSGILFHDVFPLAEPGEVGPDTSNRQRVSCNYEVMKEPG